MSFVLTFGSLYEKASPETAFVIQIGNAIIFEGSKNALEPLLNSSFIGLLNVPYINYELDVYDLKDKESSSLIQVPAVVVHLDFDFKFDSFTKKGNQIK